jgi:hypothetical protein
VGEVDVSTHARTWVRVDSAVRTCVKGQVAGRGCTYVRKEELYLVSSFGSSQQSSDGEAHYRVNEIRVGGVSPLPCFPVICPDFSSSARRSLNSMSQNFSSSALETQ